MYDNFYGQSNINVSTPMNQTNQADQKQPDQKLTKKDIILYIIVPLLVALIGAGVLFGGKGNNSPSPQPVPQQPVSQQPVSQQATIPQLHGFYNNGSAINDGTPLALRLSGLTEQSAGTFTSSGTIGVCNISVSGNVSETNIITFTAQQQQSFNCAQLTGDFTGKVTNNGSILSGQWKVENALPAQGGAWQLS